MEDNQIIRIDDRLIHGQVVVGWGSITHPDCFILIDDEIAEDDLEKELYLLGIPEEYEGLILSVTEAAMVLNKFMACRKPFVAVVKTPETAYRLKEIGLNFNSLNIGGMHSRTHKMEFNHYTYLNNSDYNYLSLLATGGVEVYIQDLPRAKRFEFSQLQEKLGGDFDV